MERCVTTRSGHIVYLVMKHKFVDLNWEMWHHKKLKHSFTWSQRKKVTFGTPETCPKKVYVNSFRAVPKGFGTLQWQHLFSTLSPAIGENDHAVLGWFLAIHDIAWPNIVRLTWNFTETFVIVSIKISNKQLNVNSWQRGFQSLCLKSLPFRVQNPLLVVWNLVR